MGYKKLVTHVEQHAGTVSLLESREQLYIKVINNNIFGTWYIYSLSNLPLSLISVGLSLTDTAYIIHLAIVIITTWEGEGIHRVRHVHLLPSLSVCPGFVKRKMF